MNLALGAFDGRVAFRYRAPNADANQRDYLLGLDSLSITSNDVPEPTTLSLVALALATVAAGMRRRRGETS